MPAQFWEDLEEARADVVREFEMCADAAAVMRTASGDIALLRFQYLPGQAGGRGERRYLGRPGDAFDSAASLHAYGAGLWCPQYLSESVGLAVCIGVENGALPRSHRKLWAWRYCGGVAQFMRARPSKRTWACLAPWWD